MELFVLVNGHAEIEPLVFLFLSKLALEERLNFSSCHRPKLSSKADLRKIRGQLQAVEKMVEADTDYSKVLMQVVAARSALKSFGDKLIQSHLHDCIEHAETQDESRKNLRAFLTVLERYVA